MKSPKEKAKELVDKYRTYIRMADKYNYLLDEDEVYIAKQCALKEVDAIMIALEEYDDRNKTYELQNMDRDFNYYSEVKKEIENYEQNQQ